MLEALESLTLDMLFVSIKSVKVTLTYLFVKLLVTPPLKEMLHNFRQLFRRKR